MLSHVHVDLHQPVQHQLVVVHGDLPEPLAQDHPGLLLRLPRECSAEDHCLAPVRLPGDDFRHVLLVLVVREQLVGLVDNQELQAGEI